MLLRHDHGTDHSAAREHESDHGDPETFHPLVLPAMPPDPGLLGSCDLPSPNDCVQIHCVSIDPDDSVRWVMATVLARSQAAAVGCVLSTTKLVEVPTVAINNHSFSIICTYLRTAPAAGPLYRSCQHSLYAAYKVIYGGFHGGLMVESRSFEHDHVPRSLCLQAPGRVV